MSLFHLHQFSLRFLLQLLLHPFILTFLNCFIHTAVFLGFVELFSELESLLLVAIYPIFVGLHIIEELFALFIVHVFQFITVEFKLVDKVGLLFAIFNKDVDLMLHPLYALLHQLLIELMPSYLSLQLSLFSL